MRHSTCLRHHRNWALVLLCTGGLVSAAATPAQHQPESIHGETYGIEDATVLRIPVAGFYPISSDQGFRLNTLTFGMECTVSDPFSGQCVFIAPVQLPAGATIVAFEMEACDEDLTAGSSIEGILLRCTGPSGVCDRFPAEGALAEIGCHYTYVPLTSFGLSVNNFNDNYLFAYIYPPSSSGYLLFHSVLVYYRLQLSPPPDTATFSDVPVGDLRRQYVEALAAAGISAGCGGGKYCPDDPVTRGQLAVFLARALGLHFPF